MMKKLFSSCAIALFVVALATGGAWAQSVIDIAAADTNAVDADVAGTAAGAYVVGTEWLTNQGTTAVTVDLGNCMTSPTVGPADRSDILYVPAIDIGINHTIVITVTNGAIAPSVNYGLYDDTGATQVADLIDFTADGSGNYTSMTFKFTGAVITGVEIAMTEDGNAPLAANRPTLVFTSAQLATGAMTLQVTEAYDDTSLPLSAPLTAAETVAMRTAQLSATVQYQTGAAFTNGNATSVIDVEATPVSRSQFVNEGAGEDTTLTSSTAAVRVASATVNNGIDVSLAAFTVTVNGNQSAILNVDMGGNLFTEGTSDFTYSSTFAIHDLTTAGAGAIDINVDGTSIVETATYTVDLSITPSGWTSSLTSLDDELAYVWTVNAMQARVPYMICETGGTNYTFFLEITNRGTQSASLSIDAVISDADGTVNTTETQNDVTTVPANSVIIVREADLDGWLTSVDDTQLYRLGLVLTVVAPQNTVDITAYQIDTTGRTAVQVLYNTNNTNDGRLWQ